MHRARFRGHQTQVLLSLHYPQLSSELRIKGEHCGAALGQEAAWLAGLP